MDKDLINALRDGGFEELTILRRLVFAAVTLPGRILLAWLRAVAIIAGARS